MATLDQLKQEATELGLEFPSKIVKADLEALIAEKRAEGTAPENVESTETDEGAKDEATQTLEENEQNEEQGEETEDESTDDEPKVNKDGFIAGKELTPKEFAEFMAKQRAKK